MEILGLCFDGDAVGAPFTHDGALVILSYVVAVLASYTALDLAERYRAAPEKSRGAWLAASAITLGGGIWSMHFIGMLAFETPLERGYDPGLTVLSALVAILAAALGFMLARRGGALRLVIAGLIVGIGVVAMHYTGMSALHVAGQVYYSPDLFGVSVAIALGAAVTALWLAFSLQTWWQRAGAAFVMAVAICGMHYVGMAATAIVAGPDIDGQGVLISRDVLAAAVTMGVFSIVLLGIMGAFLDRRLEAESIREAERLRGLNATLEQRVVERTAQLSEAAVNLDMALREAERASAAKSDFLASMSHELRTPLNAILGFSQLLQRGRAQGALTTEQSNMVEQIERSGRHLLELIEEILDLSRIEAGRLTLSITTFDAVELIDEVVASFQAIALDAGVAIHVSASENGIIVRADRTRLRQVLTNLVSNAIKYNRRGGEVDVVCRQAEGSVFFAVADTGAGIAPHLMEQLFEPFNRLGHEQSPIVGAGLGLALCKRLVTAQDGDIWAESTQNVGSTFTVALPAATAGSARHDADRAAGGEAHAARQSSLLYIEDNPSNISLMRHIIKEIDGLELVTATTPESGIDLARRMIPGVILLDINLPGMDGFEVLKILKADPVLSPIPVIALTANAMPREVQRGMEAGFHRYLTKPLDLKELLGALADVFSQVSSAEQRRRLGRSLRAGGPA